MWRVLLFLFCGGLALVAVAQESALPLMPYPQQLTHHSDKPALVLGKNWTLAVKGEKSRELDAALKRFADRVERQTGTAIRFKNTGENDAQLVITIKESTPMSPFIKDWDESYELGINHQQITLSAKQTLGILRGLETLLQLIGLQEKTIQLPQVVINDFPRFKWRGLLLDTSRHFFSVDTIKRQLDAMAAAKYNIFHWHLTDDQGWRFESKRYPKLQQLASDGEFYTQAQMREIVTYAQARGIQVLPEIDVPGHASAIAVAYPELMSAPGPYQMEYRWGVHKPTLNPANEKVYEFVEALVAEAKAIFPFEYLHIGGDEVDPEHWNNNPDIQAFMRANKIEDSEALQAYFNQRVQKILQKHQRKMIGWDEILHPNLPPNIVIQSWRGQDGVSQAAAAGFQTILSTGYYLDQPQAAAYHYRNDPIPPSPYELPAAWSVKSAAAVIEKNNHNENLGAQQGLVNGSSWSFTLPRKRGGPITGSFTLLSRADQPNAHTGFVDFAGKSRRAVAIQTLTQHKAIFALDTWMGPVEFRVNFAGDQAQGIAIVGNAPYVLAGEKIALQTKIDNARVEKLDAAGQALILGGEAALWAESVNEQSLDVRLWPRAFVVAERLWSAQALQDEHTMYLRKNAVADWSEVSTGLLHRAQTQIALERLFGKSSLAPVYRFVELLQPAYYYHRQHEKSAYETYSKADPLNRLVDALPVENETLRQFDLQLSAWLKNPRPGADYQALQIQLQRWQRNHALLLPVLEQQPELVNLAEKTQQVVSLTRELLRQRLTQQTTNAEVRAQQQKLLLDAMQIEQEIVVALVFSAQKILDSY